MFNRKKDYMFDMKEEDVASFFNIMDERINNENIQFRVLRNDDFICDGKCLWIVTLKLSEKQYKSISIELNEIAYLSEEKNRHCYFRKNS